MRHGFRFNIQYLFIYLFKAMSTKVGGTDDLYLLMQITSCETWFSFEYSLSIYLFIYSKRCQQKQVEQTTFIYLCKSLAVTNGFRFNIQYLFVYLFKLTSIEKRGTDHLESLRDCHWYFQLARGIKNVK